MGVILAPSTTVSWGKVDRIFVITETTDKQLARVREEICAHKRNRTINACCEVCMHEWQVESPARLWKCC